jgi:hypothetical protein
MLLGYLRLGVIGTRFRNLGGSQWGYEGGFGLEASITDSWNIRGEFDWIGYRSIAGIKPNEQLVSIAVIYKFGCPRCLL